MSDTEALSLVISIGESKNDISVTALVVESAARPAQFR